MSQPFETRCLPEKRDTEAPDGCDVRLLLDLPPSEHHAGAGLAHFELAAGATSRAVSHRTVEELWYFVAGEGEMWRKQGSREEVVTVSPGTALSIPQGTHFQFRSLGTEPLAAVGTTLPRWPGEGEALFVEGPWRSGARS